MWLTALPEYGHGHTTTEGGAGTHGSNLTHSGIGQSSTSGDPLHSGKGTTLSGNDMTGRTTDTSGYGSHSTGTATAGPHSSGLANKADPRVDSDLGGSRFSTSPWFELTYLTDGNRCGRDTTGSGLTGSGTHGTTGSGYGSSTAGPHSSNLANNADPRVDSDLGKLPILLVPWRHLTQC